MALDRQSIERRDFPIARRGYEIEAVDAHLALLADEYEEIARRGRAAASGGLASSAADQVRMIAEAAEQSAADIEREAQLEARQLRQDAREEAERARGEAGRQARDHVARVAEVARGLLDRVEAMDRELGGLLEGLRAGTQRLSADRSLLQGSVEEVRAVAASSGPGGSGKPSAPEAEAAPSRPPAEGDDAPAPVRVCVQPAPEAQRREPREEALAVPDFDGAEALEAAAWEPEASRSAGERDGARMVALNMALNGVAREDTQHHIERNFELDDVEALLDEVYMRAGQ